MPSGLVAHSFNNLLGKRRNSSKGHSRVSEMVHWRGLHHPIGLPSITLMWFRVLDLFRHVGWAMLVLCAACIDD